jgi:hypothetical protein
MTYIQEVENEEFERGYCPSDRFAGFDHGDGPNAWKEEQEAQNEEWEAEYQAELAAK